MIIESNELARYVKENVSNKQFVIFSKADCHACSNMESFAKSNEIEHFYVELKSLQLSNRRSIVNLLKKDLNKYNKEHDIDLEPMYPITVDTFNNKFSFGVDYSILKGGNKHE